MPNNDKIRLFSIELGPGVVAMASPVRAVFWLNSAMWGRCKKTWADFVELRMTGFKESLLRKWPQLFRVMKGSMTKARQQNKEDRNSHTSVAWKLVTSGSSRKVEEGLCQGLDIKGGWTSSAKGMLQTEHYRELQRLPKPFRPVSDVSHSHESHGTEQTIGDYTALGSGFRRTAVWIMFLSILQVKHMISRSQIQQTNACLLSWYF